MPCMLGFAKSVAMVLIVGLSGVALTKRPEREPLPSTCDPLTGLILRPEFERSIARDITQARRHGTNLCVITLDIDGLETLNKEHGREVGDLAIRATANYLIRSVRGADTVARIGGDEFGIILTDTDKAGAAVMLARMRASLLEARQMLRLPPFSFTTGVACSMDGMADVLERADTDMRLEKGTVLTA